VVGAHLGPFTGDTWGTWNTLAFQAQLAPDAATIGEPYLSNDIGSFLGPPPGSPQDDADLYTRWVQLGAFQPLLRLHSSHGNRLPWDYPQPAGNVAASFLRLREALVPYTYTLADQAATTGLPMTRPLYLDYPRLRHHGDGHGHGQRHVLERGADRHHVRKPAGESQHRPSQFRVAEVCAELRHVAFRACPSNKLAIAR
jgi:hypothetical protein